jgi:hypothetical protein
MVPLLLTMLACNTASHETDPHITTVFASPSRITALSDAACTALLPEILNAATKNESSTGSMNGAEEVSYLVVYALSGDELAARDDLILPPVLNEKIDARSSHEYIWDYFKSIIPARDRSFVTEFSILSDGPNHILAGVSPTYNNPGKWTLKVDIADAGNPYALTYSLLHEYGHLLTLNASQVPPDRLVFYHPGDQAIYDHAVASCPRYFTGEGCSNSGSYMNEFFNRFWSSFYSEWDKTSNGQDALSGRSAFYRNHEDQFLTGYAATSPQEDIAESWAYFVLSPKPDATSIASQKILFFYEYPALVSLRQEILNRVCDSFPSS